MERDYNQLQLQGNKSVEEIAGVALDGKTVYSELKLSEILLQDVDAYKAIISDKNEQIEEKEF